MPPKLYNFGTCATFDTIKVRCPRKSKALQRPLCLLSAATRRRKVQKPPPPPIRRRRAPRMRPRNKLPSPAAARIDAPTKLKSILKGKARPKKMKRKRCLQNAAARKRKTRKPPRLAVKRRRAPKMRPKKMAKPRCQDNDYPPFLKGYILGLKIGRRLQATITSNRAKDKQAVASHNNIE